MTQEAEDLNSEEDRLGWPLSDFEALLGAKKMFVPFYKLWGVAYHYSKAQQRWRKGPVCQLNAEEVVSAALHTLVPFVGTIRWYHLEPRSNCGRSIDTSNFCRFFLGGEMCRRPLKTHVVFSTQEKTIGDMWREVYKLGKQLEDLSPLASKMALEIKLQLDQLKHDLPLLTAVCNPGLRQRHWNQMTEHV